MSRYHGYRSYNPLVVGAIENPASPSAVEKIRNNLDSDVEAYLAKGGKVTLLPPAGQVPSNGRAHAASPTIHTGNF